MITKRDDILKIAVRIPCILSSTTSLSFFSNATGTLSGTVLLWEDFLSAGWDLPW